MKNKTKLVIASNAKEFLNWCATYKLNPHDYRYISGAKSIYGYRDCVIYKIGYYYKKSDIGEINSYCVLHNIKNAYMEESKENENSFNEF